MTHSGPGRPLELRWSSSVRLWQLVGVPLSCRHPLAWFPWALGTASLPGRLRGDGLILVNGRGGQMFGVQD